MLEKILGVTRVQRINYYDQNQQSFRDSLKKKPGLNFQNILEHKVKTANTVASAPYQLNLGKSRAD